MTSHTAFPFGVYSDLVSNLADLLFALPHIIEWDSIDFIVRSALEGCLAHVYHGGIREYHNFLKFVKIIIAVFM